MRCDASVVAEIERYVGWCRLWDQYRDHGHKAVVGLRAFVRIITYPAHTAPNVALMACRGSQSAVTCDWIGTHTIVLRLVIFAVLIII